MNMYGIKGILLLIICICLSGVCYGQNGKVAGKLIEEKTGEPMIGASVLVVGLNKGISSDLDGNYVLSLPAGTYSIRFKYISFQTKTIDNIIVRSGQTTILNIALKDSVAATIGEATVTAKAKTSTSNYLLTEQKKATVVTSGISATEIAKTPDRNAGDALKRISGISVQGNKYVVVRGLADRYNVALVNGVPLPSSEPDRKAFSFDVFPSSLLNSIVVNKTASPDLPGEFAGGLVQLSTKDIPDENLFQLTIGNGFNTQTFGKDFFFYSRGKKDAIGKDDGTRALPVEFPDYKTFEGDTSFEKLRLTRFFRNDWEMFKATAPMNQSYQVALGQSFKVFKNDFGIVGALTYNQNYKTQRIFRGDYNFDKSPVFLFNDSQFARNVLLGGMLNLSYKIGDKHKLTFKNFINRNGEEITTIRQGKDIATLNSNSRGYAGQYTSTELKNSQVGGEHVFTKDNIRFNWGASVSSIKREVPDIRKIVYTQGDDSIYRAYIPPGNASPNYAGKFYSTQDEKLKSLQANLTIPFKIADAKQNFKAGVYHQTKEREFQARVLGYVIYNTNWFYQRNTDSIITKQPKNLFVDAMLDTNGFRMDEITNGTDHYTANSKLDALYAMFDNNLFDASLRLLYGVRVEKYHQNLESEYTTGDKLKVDDTTTDILPSLNAIFAVSEKSNFRYSISRTLSRPEFRELAPFSFYDFNIVANVQGNPKLTRASILNNDFRFETYPKAGEAFSVSVFFKTFNHPIEQAIDPVSGGGSRFYTYYNADKATNAGVEFEQRIKLSSFLPSFDAEKDTLGFKHFMNGVGVFYNFSFINSSIVSGTETRPLQGQSPYLVNLGLQYNSEKGSGVSLLFNRAGRRIFQVGNKDYLNIYEAPRSLLDLQISQKFFHQKAELKLTAGDLLNKELILYQDQPVKDKRNRIIEEADKVFTPENDTKIMGVKPGSNVSFSFGWKF